MLLYHKLLYLRLLFRTDPRLLKATSRFVRSNSPKESFGPARPDHHL